MAKENGRDFIYLVWKNPKTRRNYTIAKLSKNGKYTFEYDFEIKDAMESGFEPLIAFADITKKYESDKLFASFSSRVPDKRRKDIDEILNKYGLETYNEYEVLKRSGGRLPIDSFEFIDPILMNGEDPILRKFYISGPRHYMSCNGKDCNKALNLKNGDLLDIELDTQNNHDKNAIKILNDNILIGYIPRYFNKEFIELLNLGWKYKLNIISFNKESNCHECVYVRLELTYK